MPAASMNAALPMHCEPKAKGKWFRGFQKTSRVQDGAMSSERWGILLDRGAARVRPGAHLFVGAVHSIACKQYQLAHEPELAQLEAASLADIARSLKNGEL
jgi:hypothetical protein